MGGAASNDGCRLGCIILRRRLVSAVYFRLFTLSPFLLLTCLPFFSLNLFYCLSFDCRDGMTLFVTSNPKSLRRNAAVTTRKGHTSKTDKPSQVNHVGTQTEHVVPSPVTIPSTPCSPVNLSSRAGIRVRGTEYTLTRNHGSGSSGLVFAVPLGPWQAFLYLSV